MSSIIVYMFIYVCASIGTGVIRCPKRLPAWLASPRARPRASARDIICKPQISH